MTKQKILVVEDESDIAEVLKHTLLREGYEVNIAANAKQAIDSARQNKPDLTLLDLMLPDTSGYDVCKKFKAENIITKIIMLTAKGEDADIVAGLELGADDYVTKPFSTSVLLARVRNVLRRKEPTANSEQQVLSIETLSIDPIRHRVLVESSELDLTATEFKLLHFLALRRGAVFTRDNIIKSIHGTDYPVTKRSIDVQVTGLRKKLGSYGDHIETIRGVGYRFRE